MRNFSLTFLGLNGVMILSPVAAFVWLMHKGFGDTLTFKDLLLISSPVPFAVIFLLGLFSKPKTRDVVLGEKKAEIKQAESGRSRD